MPRTTRNSAVEVDDGIKTVAEWKKLSHEALKLKCGEHQLPTIGNKTEMAERLCNYFRQIGDLLNNQLGGDLIPTNTANNVNDESDILFRKEAVQQQQQQQKVHVENKENVDSSNELLLELRKFREEFQTLKERQQQHEQHLDRVMQVQMNNDDQQQRKNRKN